MKKSLKHKIKQDELVTGVARAQEQFKLHGDEIKIGAVIVLVLAVGAFALSHFRNQRNRDASDAMAAALTSFHAPVETEMGAEPPEPGSGKPFPTAAEKYRKALADFEGVERRYSSTAVGRRARYYAALCRIELGENEPAEKALQELASEREGLEPALAKMALASLQERLGQVDRAADSYKQIANDASFALPRDHALLKLAKLYEEARRPADAQAVYRELLDKFPESAYANDARVRVEYLQARG